MSTWGNADESVWCNATNWQTGEVRYVRGKRCDMSPEKIVEAARSPRKRIKFRRGSDREPDDAADESEVEVSRDE